MGYCTIQEVKDAINFPTTKAPISDTIIGGFIIDAEEEIEQIYNTKFGNIEISGTCDGDFSNTTLSDSNKNWTTNKFIGYVVWIYGGTGSGQYSEIQSNTSTKLTFNTLSTIPDSTSTFRIVKLGYKEELIDGSGTREQFINYQPLIKLNELTIDSISVTPSLVYQTEASGKLELGKTGIEVHVFTKNNPKLIDIKYIYGVYPIPRIIKRLCVVLTSIRTLVAQIAGTYDDFTSISMPGGFSGSKGEPYMNIQNSLNYLMGEARGIIYGAESTGQVSGDFRTGASYRPFALFG